MHKETPSETSTQNTKDAAIRYIFKQPENFINLMNDIKEDVFKSKELPFGLDNIREFDLESDFFKRKFRNDISFIAKDNSGKDKHIILLEHQSTNNVNMPARFFIYYNQLFNLYLSAKKNDIDLHSNKKVHLPSPDDVKFILLYNGKDTFKKDYEPFYKGQDITMLDIRYNQLKNKETNSTLAGYSYMIQKREDKINELTVKGFEKNIAETMALNYAIKETKNAGYLTHILEKEDFHMIMTNIGELVDYEKDLIYAGEERGIEIGEQRGIKIGEQRGRQEGRQEGIKDRLDMLKYIPSPEQKNTLFKQIKEDALSIGISSEDFEQMKIKAGLGDKPQNLSKSGGERTPQSKETKTETKQSFKERMAEAKEAKEIHNNNLNFETKKPTNREGR